MEKLFEACLSVCESKGVPVILRDMEDDEVLASGASGYFHREHNNIVIDRSLDPTKKCAVLFHEIGHADLHKNLGDLALKMGEEEISKSMREIQAEAVAYMTASTFGIETDTSSFSYIASFAKGLELLDFQKSLDVIYKESQQLISDLKAELDSRGLNIDLTEKLLSDETKEKLEKDKGAESRDSTISVPVGSFKSMNDWKKEIETAKSSNGSVKEGDESNKEKEKNRDIKDKLVG